MTSDKDLLIGNNDMEGHAFASIDFPEINDAIGGMNYESLVNASYQLYPDTPKEVSDAIVFEYMKYTGFIILLINSVSEK